MPKFWSVRIGGGEATGNVNSVSEVLAQLVTAALGEPKLMPCDADENKDKSGPKNEFIPEAYRPVAKGCAETVKTDPMGWAAAGPALLNKGAHDDPLIESAKEDSGEALSAPVMEFVAPSCTERLDSVSSGPNASPFREPTDTGSNCIRKPVLACEKSIFERTIADTSTVVEPAGTIRGNSISSSCSSVRNPNQSSARNGSSPEALILKIVFWRPLVARRGEPITSWPKSNVLLLVQ